VVYSEVATATVNAPAESFLNRSPWTLSFAGSAGGPTPPSQGLELRERCSRSVAWTATDDAAWLTVSPPSGTTPSSVVASVDTTGLSAGVYTATLTLTSSEVANSPVTVPVVLRIVDAQVAWVTPPPAAMLSDTDYAVEYAVSGGVDGSHWIEFSTDGLDWWSCGNYHWGTGSFGDTLNQFACAQSTRYFRVHAYLHAAGVEDGGVVDGGGGADAGSGADAGLPDGEWFDLYSEVATSTLDPPAGNSLRVSPIDLGFVATAGGSNPPAQLVDIQERCGHAIDWTASDDAAWLTVTPGAGTTSSAVTLSVEVAGLTIGGYAATVTITSGDATNSPQSVSVWLTITDAAVAWTTPPPANMDSDVDFPVEYSVTGGLYAEHWIECALDQALWEPCTPWQTGLGLFAAMLQRHATEPTTWYFRVHANMSLPLGEADGGTPGADAGTANDAGSPADAGPGLDASPPMDGPGADASPPMDAGPPPTRWVELYSEVKSSVVSPVALRLRHPASDTAPRSSTGCRAAGAPAASPALLVLLFLARCGRARRRRR
jgi:hypothetical protein